MKKNFVFIIFFSFAIFLFLGGLITMKTAFIDGDYLTQFYPWSKVYAQAVKGFSFPYWCRYFNSGFPLMSEGQIGGFYPLNIIIFFLLPFNVAYNYSIILHFILGGLFTYLYTRNLGGEQWGGSLSALLFCFGSAYAGCFYNVVTMKTLVWFPLTLLLLDRFFDSRKAYYIVIAGLIAGMQFLAGFFQMAAYSFFFYLSYILYSLWHKKACLKKWISVILIFLISVSVIAFWQVMLTFNLAMASVRSAASLEFALWRSFPPPCLLTAFFPRLISFLGHQVFIGVFSLLFVIYGLLHCRLSYKIRALILISIIALLLAFGKYNPAYVFLLKITKLYSFRNPSKFLFFSLFTAAVLAGFGFSRFFTSSDKKQKVLAAKVFSTVSLLSLLIFFAVKISTVVFKREIIKALNDYVIKYIYGKPYHRYDLNTYLSKIESFYQLLTDGANLTNIYVLFSMLTAALAVAVGIYIYKRPDRVKYLRLPIFGMIFLEIYVYSFYGTGFKGNIKPFDRIRPSHPEILKVLQSDDELFRIAPFDMVNINMPWWAKPNSNILVGIDSIASYTPLAERGYKEALSSLEVVDDSLGLLSPDEKALTEKYQQMRILNVKYIISAKKLYRPFLEELIEGNAVYLYKLNNYLPRIFFTYTIDDDIISQPSVKLKVLRYEDGLVRVKLKSEKSGFLVLSENFYPGWHAYIDGEEVPILKPKGIIQAVKIEGGEHNIVFAYKPIFFIRK